MRIYSKHKHGEQGKFYENGIALECGNFNVNRGGKFKKILLN